MSKILRSKYCTFDDGLALRWGKILQLSLDTWFAKPFLLCATRDDVILTDYQVKMSGEGVCNNCSMNCNWALWEHRRAHWIAVTEVMIWIWVAVSITGMFGWFGLGMSWHWWLSPCILVNANCHNTFHTCIVHSSRFEAARIFVSSLGVPRYENEVTQELCPMVIPFVAQLERWLVKCLFVHTNHEFGYHIPLQRTLLQWNEIREVS